jgi:predicted ATPase
MADSSRIIRTPDQRLRVFVSSTLQELGDERKVAHDAIEHLHLSPVMFELGARPHPPKDLYRAYLDQSHIFIGLYWQKYGWVAPDMDVSGLEDEYNLSSDKPRLIYIKGPAPDREARLNDLLRRIQNDNVSYKHFGTLDELRESIVNDLMMILSERFEQQSAARREPPLKRPPTNVPIPRTPLVGRQQELAIACELLQQTDVSLVTLTGPGGTGKSRLALHIALNLLNYFEDGAFLVILTPIRDPELVVPTIAQTLGVREAGDSRSLFDLLVEHLRDKHLLLLLDNFEQVVAAAPIVARLIEACPHLTVLVTSRAPLHLRVEKELFVPPLGLPDLKRAIELSQLSQYAAVELFIQRAQSLKPDFTATNLNAPAIAEICHRLDGLPLAIELAAARIKLLSPQALLSRLDRRLDLLTSGGRDLPARQKTLRSAIAWSYDLLSDHAQALFRRLSAFAGSWTLEAAEAVCDVDPNGELDTMDDMQLLVDSNLIAPPIDRGDEVRFGFLETIREFAAEQLAAAPDEERLVRSKHAAHFLALVELAEVELLGADQTHWLDRLEIDHDNVRAALSWSKDHDVECGLRMTGALWRFWEFHTHLSEGRAWLETFIARSSAPTAARAKALNGAGALADYLGDYASARRYFEDSLAISQALGDQRRIAAALNNLALVTSFQLDYAAARQMFEQSLAIKRTIGDRWPIANTLDNLGRIAIYQRDYRAAYDYHCEALAIFRDLGERLGISTAVGNLGEAQMYLGDFAAAHASLIESLELVRDLGEKDGVADCLERFASLAACQAQPQRSAQLFGAAQTLRQQIGTRPAPPDQRSLDDHIAQARAQLDAATFEAAWRAGEGRSLDQAIALALKG